MTLLALTAAQQRYVDELDSQIRLLPHQLSERRDFAASVRALREHGSFVAAVTAGLRSHVNEPIIGKLAA